MEFSATSKYIRTSTRKVRIVADGIRKLSPNNAMIVLSGMRRFAAKPLFEVIKSALSNAKQKNINSESLVFKNIEVMGGPVMKRWHAVSRGRAHGFKKRMTHVRVTLTERADNENTNKMGEVKN